MSVDSRPAVAAIVRNRRAVPRWLAAVLIGVGIGVLTSYGQAHLDSPWAALTNSASPWLAGGFAAGALQMRPRSAAFAGLLTCLLEVGAYYATTVLRGYAVAETEIVFWGVCALIGGPLFAIAGYFWWHWQMPVGAALLPAAFLAESIGLYALVLHYSSTAVLYAVIGLAIAVLLAIRVRPRLQVGWLLLGLTALGIAGEFIVGQVSQVTFG